MRILFLTPYPHNQAPSQRFRFEQYFPYFLENSIKYSIAPFLDLKTWNIFYSSKNSQKKAWGIIKGILNRLFLLLKLHNYDIVLIHREACPVGPAFFEYVISKILRKKIIFDFDDAIWLLDVSEANGKLGWLKFPNKTSAIIKYASAVSAGNSYLSDFALKFNTNVHIIPTTIDLDYHQSLKNYKLDPVTIGWTGTSTTIKHFEIAYPFLEKLKEKYRDKIRFAVISNKPVENRKLHLDFVPWNKDSEIADLSRLDIGIMPLPDDQWAKGKCGFKGLQYMALGIPAVMSPVGVNKEIIDDGINGFLASTELEWMEKLSALIESETLRKNIGLKGKETILNRYSVESQKAAYLKLFKSV